MTTYEKYHSLKVQFVQVLAKLLIFDEWNNKLLADAEKECGFVKGYCHIIFPNGLREIVDFFESWQDQKMLELLSQQETPAKIRDKIDLALKVRIKNCTPKLVYSNDLENWNVKQGVSERSVHEVREYANTPQFCETNSSKQKSIHLKNRTYFTTPSNTLFATKIAFRTCDLIWRYAGDTSIDHNYYTKRSLLFSVYISSILYYIQDKSENNIDTDKYITKSLSSIITMFSKCKNIFKLPNPVDIPIIRLFL
ncbi:COQ9 family protein [Candidatus Tisiphia endosymbiont of Thecophora atra]|uniref:COQ9 family protein n=1 Tax=Candidatus Tisiphia endosymbiont of Thecophora atra TaxID=3066258 RepID=UPI00312CB83E